MAGQRSILVGRDSGTEGDRRFNGVDKGVGRDNENVRSDTKGFDKLVGKVWLAGWGYEDDKRKFNRVGKVGMDG